MKQQISLLTLIGQNFNERGDIRETVRMMAAAFLGKDLDASAGCLPEVDQVEQASRLFSILEQSEGDLQAVWASVGAT